MKLVKYIIYFLFILICKSPISLAKTHFLLMDPGASWINNYPRYYNTIRRGYEVTGKLGIDRKVMAKNGTWLVSETTNLSPYSLLKDKNANVMKNGKPVYPPIQYPSINLADFNLALWSNGKPNDTVVIYLTGHGNAPSGPGKPETAKICFLGKDYTMKELLPILKNNSKLKIKIVTQTCFGGGVHYLARELSNVCSASTSPYFTPNRSDSTSSKRFDLGFWNHILETKGKTSFAQASIEGFSEDISNLDLGSLSSFDYVDFVLKRGPYKKNWEPLPNRTIELPDGQTTLQAEPPLNYDSVLPATRLINSPYQFSNVSDLSDVKSLSDLPCFSVPIQEEINRLSDLSRVLQSITADDKLKEIKLQKDHRPEPLRTVFHEVITDMEKNGAAYLATAKEYDFKYRELEKRWEAHQKKFKKADVVFKWWEKEGRTRSDMQKEFDDLRQAAQKDLKRFSFNHQMLERLERLIEFNVKATSKEKKKFTELLKCEWEPL